MTGFKDIVGHEQVINHLQNAIKLNKVSHAYIFNGEKGSGKNLLANMFAMTLQCEKGDVEPCLICSSCKKAMSKNHPDIISVLHEKPNSIGVEDIRGQVIGDIMIKPYSSPYKIYIIKEAEKLTVQAQNALLKSIEEPPAYVVVILLTTNIDVLLPTILSRCVTLNLKVVPDNIVRNYLMEHLEIPDYQAKISAAFAQGNIGKAIKLATSDSFNEIKDEALFLVKHVKEMEIYEVIEAVKKVADYKLEIDDYLDLLMIWYRDVLLFKATRDVNDLIFKDQINDIREQSRVSSYEGLETIIVSLEKAKTRLKANVNFDLIMELLFLTIKEN
ncbi:MAG TPA: AAA family ATPase [Candidatus Merdenecus merdavium]|nr:AAA family ATPase [Candidatus Merdenecus merdavium]